MKTTLKQLTAGTFIALLLLVGNVKAEGTELKASKLEFIETTLQLEGWMTDETVWNVNSVYTIDFAQETETSLQLENWMTSENIWNLDNSFVTETEAGLELENWMTSEDIWKVEKSDVEEKLVVENWMLNSDVWK